MLVHSGPGRWQRFPAYPSGGKPLGACACDIPRETLNCLKSPDLEV